MEIVGHNAAKLRLDERIYEVISIIKPTHKTEPCTFLEGNLWAVRKGHYNDKLVNRTYHLINHHLYAVHKIEGPLEKVEYFRVSGRGNINPITFDEAFEIINTREGYIEDSALTDLGAETDPAIPYNTVNCDW